MELLTEITKETENHAVIKVIGVGGGGSNAVKRMIEAELKGVKFFVVNTDLQALGTCKSAELVPIGANTTHGLGAGSDPEKGRRAADEDRDKLKEIVEKSDMVFVTAGMGGGTGTGAAPLIAQLAKDSGALTVAVVTKPFIFEGRKRMLQAETGLVELREHADALIVIPNQKLIEVTDKQTRIRDAFRRADDVLLNGVKSISDLITETGYINLDFADVKTIMHETGKALMGIGKASGENRAAIAAQNAISSPLLEENTIEGSTGVLVNVTGGLDMTVHELQDSMEVITRNVDEEAHVIFGLVYDETMEDEIQVTVIATGFDRQTYKKGKTLPSESLVDLDELLARNFERERKPLSMSTASPSPRVPNPSQEELSSRAVEQALEVPTILRRINRQKEKK